MGSNEASNDYFFTLFDRVVVLDSMIYEVPYYQREEIKDVLNSYIGFMSNENIAQISSERLLDLIKSLSGDAKMKKTVSELLIMNLQKAMENSELIT
jgi:hypothetical protein